MQLKRLAVLTCDGLAAAQAASRPLPSRKPAPRHCGTVLLSKLSYAGSFVIMMHSMSAAQALRDARNLKSEVEERWAC